MEKISQRIVCFISRNMTIDDEEMLDVYKYGIEIALSSVLNFVLIIISSLILRDLSAGLIFMAVFIFLRSYTGGYHAETYLKCNIAFVCTFFLTFLIGRFLYSFNYGIYASGVMLVLSYIPIWFFSPVKNRHKFLSEEKIKRSRIISSVVYLLSAILAMVLCINDIWYGYLLAATDNAIAVLILIEIFMQKKGYHPIGD